MHTAHIEFSTDNWKIFRRVPCKGQTQYNDLKVTYYLWIVSVAEWSHHIGVCAAQSAEPQSSSAGWRCLWSERGTASLCSRSPARGLCRGGQGFRVAPLSSPCEEEAPPGAGLDPGAPETSAPVNPSIRGYFYSVRENIRMHSNPNILKKQTFCFWIFFCSAMRVTKFSRATATSRVSVLSGGESGESESFSLSSLLTLSFLLSERHFLLRLLCSCSQL